MHRIIGLVAGICLGLASAARAQQPSTIPFAFQLTNSGGSPVTVPVTVRFSLYTAPTGGTAVWTESKAVTPVNGMVNTMLGDATPFQATPPGVPFNVPYYIGVKVGDDAEMQPRLRLGAVPYAMGITGVTVDSGGRVGIGTNTPQDRLDVSGGILLGVAQKVAATGGPEALRIVRGKVSFQGAVMSGTGFTATRTSAAGGGVYKITFTSPFNGLPVVVASTAAFGPGTAVTEQVSTNTCVIHTYAGTASSDITFNFIAVGPRY